MFRSKYRTSLTPLALLIVVMLLALCVGFVLPFGLTALREGDGTGFSLFLISSPLGIILGMGAVSVLYAVAYLWYETLIFDRDELRHRTLPLPFVDSKPVKYDQIGTVRQSMRGVVVIEARQGRSMILRLGGYEGGWVELVEELQRRVGKGRLPASTLGALWERTSADRWSLGLTILVVVLFSAALGMAYFQDFGRAGIAWDVAASVGYGKEILSYAIAEDGSVWLLEREGIPFSDSERYRLVHQSNGEWSVEDLPSMSDLLPMERERYTYPSQVLIDDGGIPWVNFRFLDRILHSVDDGWEWLRIPSSVSQGYVDEFIPSDGAFWGRHQDQVVVVEPAESGVWSIPSFDADPQPELELFRTPLGGLAMTYFPSGRGFISRLSLAPGGLGWEEVELWDEAMQQRDEGIVLEREKTLATSSVWGTLYLLVWTGGGCSQGEKGIMIGASVDSGRWEWAELTLPQGCGDPLALEGLVVDPHGRAWVAEPQGLWIFGDLDFRVGDPGGGSLMGHYTEENSGYYHGELQIDEDGQIWSLDEGGRMLVGLDGVSDPLPRPMPEGIANILGSDWLPLIFEYLGVAALAGILAVLWNANRYRGATKWKTE